MSEAPPQRLTLPDGTVLAFHCSEPAAGGARFVWLGGFHSDMTGSKAADLHAWAQGEGHGFTRFDYSGHGQSGGRFEDGTISRWRDDALAVIDAGGEGPLILVGSSMGGWIALLVAAARPHRVAGMVLVAPAPDFTEDLMWTEFGPDVRREIERDGQWMRPSAYGEEPYAITRALIEDGRRNLVLRSAIGFSGPVRILHGQCDAEVPWRRSLALAEALSGHDVRVTLFKDGDHRLSTPAALSALRAACADVAAVAR